MTHVYTIGDLKEAIKNFNDDDEVVVEIHEGDRSEDLYNFYVDHIDMLTFQDGSTLKEVRICI